ncbi:MAG: iron-containing alcohol dehydrogenase, partial [Sphaerochaeta sp.]
MVSNFTYYTPTEVVFGKDTEHAAGALVKRYGGTKVLLHYGSQSAKASGLLDRVEASLKAEGIDYVELGGVVPNPRLSLVHEGIALGKREGVDFILAVGGGSALDSAKAIAYGLHDGGEVWDFYAGKRTVP